MGLEICPRRGPGGDRGPNARAGAPNAGAAGQVEMFRGVQESINSESGDSDRAGSPPAQRDLRKWLKGLLLFLMVLAAVEFVTRGPWRALSESGDFAMPYLSAGVWLRGGNPYDHGLVDHLWAEAGGAPER